MEDVKGKMKGILKKVNIPFSSPSSSPFKGQAHVLGSSPTPPNPQSSRLLNPPLSSPATNIAASGNRSEPDITSRVGDFMSGEGSAEIMAKLLNNLVRESGNERFRRIRLGNLRIKEAVGDARGGLELLECVGFRVKEEEGERWAVMEEPTRGRIDVIREAVSLMEGWRRKDEGLDVEGLVSDRRVEPQKVDRKVRVFFSVPESVAAKIDLSDSFYKLSTEELKRESDARRKKIADSQLLIPRSYKEKQAVASRRKYKLTVIRIQFPDRVVLQGVFLPWERTTALYEDHISAELDLYQYQQGLFGKDMAKRQLQNPDLNPVHWWRLNGADTPHLKTMAMKILSLTTSSSGCERNWSTFEMIHSKKRNKLDSKRLNDLVFVKFNALLKTKYSNTSRDPLEAMSLESGKIQEWMVNIDADEDENEDGDDEVFPGEGLTWAQLGDIVDADQDTRRPPRLTTNKEVSISYQRKRKRKISEMDETQLEGSSSSDDDHILSTMPTIAESTSDED